MEFIPGSPHLIKVKIDESSYSSEFDPQRYRDLLLERAVSLRSHWGDDNILNNFASVIGSIWSFQDAIRFVVTTEAPSWSFGKSDVPDVYRKNTTKTRMPSQIPFCLHLLFDVVLPIAAGFPDAQVKAAHIPLDILHRISLRGENNVEFS